MSEPVNRRWFRFSLWNVLSAFTCFSIAGGAFSLLQHDQQKLANVTFAASVVLIIVCPFLGCGVLFGRPIAGLIGGVMVLGALVALVALS
jgi:hypothetical protein